MTQVSRRSFLSIAACAAAASAIPSQNLFAANATPLIGLQLYSVRVDLAKDFLGTLKRVADVGYREVEAAGFYQHSAGDVRQMMSDARLRCVSAHYSLADLLKSTDEIIAYAKTLGLEYVICSAPSGPDSALIAKYPGGAWQWALHGMTLDDWKWNADQLNQMGCKMQDAGLKFGYHNHTMGFRKIDGSTGYRILLEDTDPRCVSLELDCGWAIAAGQNPAEMLPKYPGRFSMLHLKDLKPAVPGADPSARISTVMGTGTVDYRPIFSAAEATGVRHYFVEQEEFDGPIYQQIAADYKNSNILARGGSLQKI